MTQIPKPASVIAAVNAFRKNYKRKFLQQCGINPLETAPDGELMENHFTLRYIIK